MNILRPETCPWWEFRTNLFNSVTNSYFSCHCRRNPARGKCVGFYASVLVRGQQNRAESTQLSFAVAGCARCSGGCRRRASSTAVLLQAYSAIHPLLISKRQFFYSCCQSLGYSRLPAVTRTWKRARRSVWAAAGVPLGLFNSGMGKNGSKRKLLPSPGRTSYIKTRGLNLWRQIKVCGGCHKLFHVVGGRCETEEYAQEFDETLQILI